MIESLQTQNTIYAAALSPDDQRELGVMAAADGRVFVTETRPADMYFNIELNWHDETTPANPDCALEFGDVFSAGRLYA